VIENKDVARSKSGITVMNNGTSVELSSSITHDARIWVVPSQNKISREQKCADTIGTVPVP